MYKNNKLKSTRNLLLIFILVSFLFSCSINVGSRNSRGSYSEGQGISRKQLKATSKQFATKISKYFNNNSHQDGVFVAMLPVKNDTTEDIPVGMLEFSLVNYLLDDKIYTVRTEDRKKALEEVEFNLSGLSDNEFSIGKMKTPNYFVQVNIQENYIRSGSRRLVEYSFLMELRSAETQLVVASDSESFKKKINNNGDVSW